MDEEKEMVVCADCGKMVKKSDAHVVNGDHYVCEECRENYVACYDCGTLVSKNLAIYKGGHWFCGDCVVEWTVCDNCNEVERISDTHEASNGDVICDYCYDNYYHCCNDCGDLIHVDDLHYDDDEGEYYCDGCWDRHYSENGVMEYHSFHSYCPKRVDANDDDILFGVELECDDGCFDYDYFSKWTDNGDLIHFEHDGSLSDDGVECISQPCTLKFHKEKMLWRDLCKRLRDQGFHSHDTDDCGLHVHIGRESLSPTLIVKMDVFINRGKDFFTQIARRSEIYDGGYDKEKSAHPEKGFHKHEYDIPEAMKNHRNWSFYEERYVPVNTRNRDTIEVRIFRGTLNAETLLGTVEMLHAMVKFLDTVPISRIYNTDKNIMAFIRYIGENAAKYENCIRMMRRLVRFGDGWVKAIGEIYGKNFMEKSEGYVSEH